MNLDELRLTRRNFLKLIGATAAGTMVPGLALPIEQPAVPCVPLGGIKSYTNFLRMHPAWRMIQDSILGTALILPYDVRGEGILRLFWTSEEDVEFGWWADWLTFDRGQTLEAEAIPPTIGHLKTLGLDSVTKSKIGTLDMRPGEMLNLNLCSPNPLSGITMPKKGYAERPGGIYGSEPRRKMPTMAGVHVHGMEITYEAGA